MQLGEVKRGLKAYKATGATNEDFQRHVMFVQVGQPLPSVPPECSLQPLLSFMHPAQLGDGTCLLITDAPVLAPWTSPRTYSVLHAPKDAPIHVRQCFLSKLDLQLPSWLSRFLLHRTICMRSWIGTLCLGAGPSGSLT